MSVRQGKVRWAVPALMDWTVMPIAVVAKAWTDSGFKSALLASPDAVFRQMANCWPYNISFTIHEDAPSVRNLPLPVYKSSLQSLSAADLLALAQQETGGDKTLEYFLPADVIVRALTDAQFKATLLSNANAALNSMGYDTSYATYSVFDNTVSSYHLTLPVNPLSQQSLSYYALLNRLLGIVGSATTKCCASGTCNDDDDN